MSTFLQTSSGDLDISTGKLVIANDPDICTAIKLTNRFQLFLGEWFLDARIGIPYYQFVYVKNPDVNAIGQLFQRVIMQTPNVLTLLQSNLEYTSSDRSLVASFKIQTQSGAVIEGGPGLPFIVTLNGSGVE